MQHEGKRVGNREADRQPEEQNPGLNRDRMEKAKRKAPSKKATVQTGTQVARTGKRTPHSGREGESGSGLLKPWLQHSLCMDSEPQFPCPQNGGMRVS